MKYLTMAAVLFMCTQAHAYTQQDTSSMDTLNRTLLEADIYECVSCQAPAKPHPAPSGIQLTNPVTMKTMGYVNPTPSMREAMAMLPLQQLSKTRAK